MTAGVKYEVVVEYKTAGNLQSTVPQMTGQTTALGSAMARTKSEVSGMSSAVMDLGTRVTSTFTGMVEKAGALARSLAMVAGGLVVGAATEGVVHLNAELEQTNLSLAAIFNAQGYTSNFQEALTLSANEIARMKQDVKALPGTFQELANIMKDIAPMAAQAAASPDQIRKMAGRGMLVGSILGLDSAMTGRELSMLLAGRAGAHNVLGTRMGFGGEAAKAFNAEDPAKRLADVEKALGKFDEAADAFGHSWKAISTTLKDDVLYGILQPATAPLFERVKKSIVDITNWYDQNPEKIGNFVGELGDGLANAWTKGTEVFESWLPAIRTFAHDAYEDIAGIWRKVGPDVEHVAEILRKSLLDGSAIKRIEDVLKLYMDLKIAGAVTGVASPLMSPFARMAFGGLGGGAAAGEAGAAGAVGTGALAAGAGVALAGIAVAATLAGGEIKAVTDGSSAYHKEAVEAAGHLAKAGSVLANDFTPTVSGLSEAWQWLGVQATNLGAHLGGGIDAIVHANDMLDDLDELLVQKTKGTWAQDFFWEDPDKVANQRFRASLRGDNFTPDRSDDPLDFTHSSGAAAAAADKGGDKSKAHATPQVHIDHVEITVSSNQDPSRIAREVANELAEMRRHPQVSRHARNWTSVAGG